MQCILSALKSESQPFIDHYNLVRDNKFQFPVFRNKDLFLIAIGVGKKLIEYRISHFFKNVNQRRFQFINIGFAGGKKGNHMLGDVYIINKINDDKSQNSYFPDILYKHSYQETELTTVHKEITDGGVAYRSLVDMEASEIFRVCSKLSPIHNIAFIKVVSDFMDKEIESYNKEYFSNLIKENLRGINLVVKNMKLIENINPNILDHEDEEWLKQVIYNLRLTKSQSLILEKYLKGKKNRNSQKPHPLVPEFEHASKSERNKKFQNICEKLTN